MYEKQYPWEEALRKYKILKIKTIRAVHRFDRKTGASRYARKIALMAALKTISFLAPNAQVNLYAQEIHKKDFKSGLVSKANTLSPLITYDDDFLKYTSSKMNKRQANFAKDLWNTLQDNVEEVQKASNKEKKSKILRELFGQDINTNYYCSIGGLRSLQQTIDKKNYPEYKFLMKCIENPHACLSVIKGLEENFGTSSRTNNIRNKLRDVLKKNSSSVCIAIVNTQENSNSGKHFVFVLPNKVVVDSLVSETDTIKGKVISFNVDKIADSDSYFVGSRNTGHLFNITEMSENDLMLLFYDRYVKENKYEWSKINNKSWPKYNGNPVATLPNKKQIVWCEVSRKRKSR